MIFELFKAEIFSQNSRRRRQRISRRSNCKWPILEEELYGWLNNFLARRNLVLRRVTTSRRDIPTEAKELTKSFLESAATSLLNMDEASFYLDEPSIFLKFRII